MRKTLSVTILLFSAAVLISGACTQEKPQFKGPHLTFEVTKVDFGEMDQQEEKSQEVVFRNTGSELLEIQNVRSSCGCTAAVPTDNSIEPGESGILNVTFKSGKSQGEIEKVITVLTNDSLTPATRLPVTAYVKTDIDLQPRAIDFGEVTLGESRTEEARIMSQNGEPFEIVFVEADSASFDYELTPVEEDGNPGYVFKLTLRASDKPNSFYKVVNLRTDNNRSPLHRLTVVANVLGNVRIEPRTVLMRSEVGGEGQTKTVSLTSVGDATFALLNVRTTKDIAQIETRTIEEGKNYEIDVSFTPGEAGRQKDYLVIQTDDEFEGEVRIPITIFTAKKRPEMGEAEKEAE